MSEKTLRICHLYPDLLNLYGDRGNILCMAPPFGVARHRRRGDGGHGRRAGGFYAV